MELLSGLLSSLGLSGAAGLNACIPLLAVFAPLLAVLGLAGVLVVAYQLWPRVRGRRMA